MFSIMKLSNQTKLFINGFFLIVIALLIVTILPPIVRAKTGMFSVANYIYYQVEFFVLAAASVFYLFSPKYYKEQVLSILLGILYYILFVKFYS